jgi:heterodisulfide reductase subunit A
MRSFPPSVYDNVVTSIEFERILSASGPYKGHVRRPSEGDFPQRIAFVQCVGSRDRKVGREYCSSVCCMYATKEAVIAKEHAGEGLETTIFMMDMRAHGKGFDAYYEKAAAERGVRYIRSRVASVEEIPQSKNLVIAYETERGEMVKEEFDLVVLSVGLGSTESVRQLAGDLGVDLNEYGFCQTDILEPMRTSRPGLFVAGVFQGPKDIPESVTQASAAAAEASTLLSEARGTLWEEKEYPPERDLEGQEARVGVFICHCGRNIGGVVNVPAVVEYAKRLPRVVYAEHNLYTCSQDTQDKIAEKITEHRLNRVVVASCTPRTHEPLFQETLRNAALNPYLFEMTNIREHGSWAHQREPDAATSKAKDLVRMAVAKASMLESLEPLTVPLTQKALVIGGGVAGMTAALDIAGQGFDVCLAEKESELGGNLRNLHYLSEVGDVQAFLDSLRSRVLSEPRIEVLLSTRLQELGGYIGSFQAKLVTESAGETATKETEHGVVVVATGAEAYQPTEYLYGQDPRIVTQIEFESMIVREKVDWSTIRNVVMIQCVGSRDDERPYCSKVCCGQAVKNAEVIIDRQPDAQVFILYRDVRTYGFRERYYNVAKEKGTFFIRYEADDAPHVTLQNGDLAVEVDDPVLRQRLRIPADMLVLSTGVVPAKGNEALAKQLKVPLNEDGFFLEAHVKLRPVDFATEGVFLAGLAHSPRSLDESIAQAHAAASHALVLLARGEVTVEPIVAWVDEDKCIGCGLCVSLCPYNATQLVLKEGGRKAEKIAASCKGCGTCAASCVQQAIEMKHFTDRALIAQVEAALA